MKSKQKDEDESNSNSPNSQPKTLTASLNVRDFDWNVANEYDPMWPNDYEKVAKGWYVFNLYPCKTGIVCVTCFIVC